MRTWFRKPLVVAGALVGTVLIPFVLTAVELLHPRPYVVLDLAQTEMRVRSVFSSHPPLIGLPGRLGDFGVHTGSHPGPISFFVLAPFYRLFGSDPWALFAAALSVNFLWICVALWLGWRRGGLAMLIGVGAVVLVLVHTFGIIVVEQPWNPYLPLMAWSVVLLAAWSVLADDVAMLPVLVVAATWCMQTHIPYLGMGAGVLIGIVVASVVWLLVRNRLDRAAVAKDRPPPLRWLTGAPATRPSPKKLLIWIASSAVLGVLLWIPPIYDQIKWGRQGNLNILWDDLAHPPQAAGGLSQGIRLLLQQLNVAQLFSAHRIKFVTSNAAWPGVVLLVVWVAAVVVAWRYRNRLLMLLDAVVAGTLVLALVALSKIYGDVYWYLMLWMWTIVAAMVASIVWSGIEVVRGLDLAPRTRHLVRGAGAAVLAAGVALLFVAIVVEAARAEIPDRRLSNQMAHVVPQTIADIKAGRAPGDTGRGSFVVNWNDPVNLGDGGYTLLDELNGHGIRAGLRPFFWGIIPSNEIVRPGTERGVVHLAVGNADIARWRAKPGAVEVATYDGRSPAQKREYVRLRAEARRIIRAAGRDPGIMDTNGVTGASLDTSLPAQARRDLSRMGDIGLPVAVFLAPPGSF